MTTTEDRADRLDGCTVAGFGPPTTDAQIAGVVLFASVDDHELNKVARRRAVLHRQSEWVQLWGAPR